MNYLNRTLAASYAVGLGILGVLDWSNTWTAVSAIGGALGVGWTIWRGYQRSVEHEREKVKVEAAFRQKLTDRLDSLDRSMSDLTGEIKGQRVHCETAMGSTHEWITDVQDRVSNLEGRTE